MAPTNARSLMKDFRASFRRKKVTDPTPKIDKVKEQEEEELAKLAELKENLSGNCPPKYKDADLLGFLRARSLNVKEAEKLMRLDFALRQFLQIEDFVKNYELSELNKMYSVSGTIGFDKEGSLVRVMNVGLSDIKGFLQAVSTIDNFRLLMWYTEKDLLLQEAENKRTGRKQNQITYILNIADLSFSQITYKPALDTALLAVKLLQEHFHDIPKAVFLVNAPNFFSSAFKLFKPVIGDSLHQRIRIFDNNGKEELLKLIDADILPAYLGGNRTDSYGDPECKEIIGIGGKIPESYYANNFLESDDPDVTTATVPAGSSLNFRFPVPSVGSCVKWHVQTKEHDIGIGVFLEQSEEEIVNKEKQKREDMSKMEQLTPIIRSQCHICPEIGSTTSWFSGIGVLHLDNTYSWMASKEVMFKVTIEPPTEEGKRLN